MCEGLPSPRIVPAAIEESRLRSERPAGRARGGPSSIRPMSLKTTAPDAAPPIAGSVRVAAGPWSLEEGWWSDAPADRDYWDVELSDGGLYRIYRERAAGAWFADGVYD